MDSRLDTDTLKRKVRAQQSARLIVYANKPTRVINDAVNQDRRLSRVHRELRLLIVNPQVSDDREPSRRETLTEARAFIEQDAFPGVERQFAQPGKFAGPC